MSLPRAAPPCSAQAAAQRDAWKAALARASGTKVLDDPRLLKKKLKREARQKSKSQAAWKERVERQQEDQAARQQKCVRKARVALAPFLLIASAPFPGPASRLFCNVRVLRFSLPHWSHR